MTTYARFVEDRSHILREYGRCSGPRITNRRDQQRQNARPHHGEEHIRTAGPAGGQESSWPRTILTYVKSVGYALSIKPKTIRTSLDIPALLHQQLQEAARRKGCSARSLIIRAIEREIRAEPATRTRIQLPLVPGKGDPIRLTNEEIYDIIFSGR